MATNRVNAGETTNHTPSGAAVSSGSVVVLGEMLGVAAADIADGGTGAVNVEGVYELPAVSGAAFVHGRAIVWDVSAGAADDHDATAASGDLTGGCLAWETKTAGNGDTIRVKLNVGPSTVTP